MRIKGPGVIGEVGIGKYILSMFSSALRIGIAIAIMLLGLSVYSPLPIWLLEWVPIVGALVIAVPMYVMSALPADE